MLSNIGTKDLKNSLFYSPVSPEYIDILHAFFIVNIEYYATSARGGQSYRERFLSDAADSILLLWALHQ